MKLTNFLSRERSLVNRPKFIFKLLYIINKVQFLSNQDVDIANHGQMVTGAPMGPLISLEAPLLSTHQDSLPE